MPSYTVQTESWFLDARGRPQRRLAGDIVTLSEDEAAYLLLTGQIALTASSPPVVPTVAPYRAGDTVIYIRDGVDQILPASALASFFAPVLGGGTAPPAVTLTTLTLSTLTATAGQPFSATITGRTAGSTLSATSSDGTALTVSGTTVSGTFTTAGSPTLTLTETLAGAAGSPKQTTLTVTVSAAIPPADLSTNFDDESNAALTPGLTT